MSSRSDNCSINGRPGEFAYSLDYYRDETFNQTLPDLRAFLSFFESVFISSEINLMSARTGMKFVSPLHRGTMWKWIWSSTPAPLARPMFAPKLYPCGCISLSRAFI